MYAVVFVGIFLWTCFSTPCKYDFIDLSLELCPTYTLYIPLLNNIHPHITLHSQTTDKLVSHIPPIEVLHFFEFRTTLRIDPFKRATAVQTTINLKTNLEDALDKSKSDDFNVSTKSIYDSPIVWRMTMIILLTKVLRFICIQYMFDELFLSIIGFRYVLENVKSGNFEPFQRYELKV